METVLEKTTEIIQYIDLKAHPVYTYKTNVSAETLQYLQLNTEKEDRFKPYIKL